MAVCAVTGISGYVGTCLVPLLQAEPGIERVVGMDTRPPRHVLPGAEFVRMDVRDAGIGDLLARSRATTLVHLAFLLRESAGLTQQELAARAGMHKLGVAKLEQGLREPTWATVQALAKALGLTCLDFVAEEGEAPRKTPAPIGRPRTRPAEGNGTAELKRPRGRPRKAPVVAQEARPGDAAADRPSGEEGGGKAKGKRGKVTGD
jgi:transcriptional regulator with XRE-family HTH domain